MGKGRRRKGKEEEEEEGEGEENFFLKDVHVYKGTRGKN